MRAGLTTCLFAALSAICFATGHLKVKVVVVEDLVPKPVPLTDFVLTDSSGKAVANLRTDTDGTAETDVVAGSYTFQSASPLELHGKKYTWHKQIVVEDKPVSITFTQGDAEVSDVTAGASPTSDGATYNAVKGGVVTVLSDSGHGSGFLIDNRGLILTNHHVVAGSMFLSVRFVPGTLYDATLVADDAEADVAVIRIAKTVVSGKPILTMANPAGNVPLASEGDHVLAVGNPLHQSSVLTSGIVSKVEPDALISDININHGNSGGPLLNAKGQVIGVTTFLDSSVNGPGISGVVAITKAARAIKQAQEQLANLTEPSGDARPDVSPISIPQSAFDAIDPKDNGSAILIKAPHNFYTVIETPFDYEIRHRKAVQEYEKIASRRYKKGSEAPPAPDAGREYWLKYVGGEFDPVVIITVRPVPQETSGSKWGHILGAITKSDTKSQFEIRDDFTEMVLLHGDSPVIPLRRNRIGLKYNQDNGSAAIHDAAYLGLYEFDPKDFDPSQPLELKVRVNGKQEWMRYRVGAKDQERIWNQFAGYREYLASKQGGK